MPRLWPVRWRTGVDALFQVSLEENTNFKLIQKTRTYTFLHEPPRRRLAAEEPVFLRTLPEDLPAPGGPAQPHQEPPAHLHRLQQVLRGPGRPHKTPGGGTTNFIFLYIMQAFPGAWARQDLPLQPVRQKLQGASYPEVTSQDPQFRVPGTL